MHCCSQHLVSQCSISFWHLIHFYYCIIIGLLIIIYLNIITIQSLYYLNFKMTANKNNSQELNIFNARTLLGAKQITLHKECQHLHKELKTKAYSNCTDCGVFLTMSIPAIRDTDSFRITTSISERIKDMLKHQLINRRFSHNVIALKDRTKVVDWLCGIGEELKQSLITIHKAISYFDTVITIEYMKNENQLKLYALASLQIASKYYELDKNIPRVKALLQAANYSFTSTEIKNTEKIILNDLNWALECVTPMDFIDFFLAQGVCFVDDKILQGNASKHVSKKITDSIRKYCEFFADLCAQHYSFVKYDSIDVASAIIAATRKILKFQKIWCDHLTALCGMEFLRLKECFEQIFKHYYQMFPCKKGNVEDSYVKQATVDLGSIHKATPTNRIKDSSGLRSSRYSNESKMSTADKDSSSNKKNSITIKVENPISIKANLFTTTFKAYLNTSRNNCYEVDHKQSRSVNPTGGRKTTLRM